MKIINNRVVSRPSQQESSANQEYVAKPRISSVTMGFSVAASSAM